MVRADVLAASPDTVVQGFRGARPDLLRGLDDRLGTPQRPLTRRVLGTGHRMPPAIQLAWQRAAQRIPALETALGARRPRPVPPGGDPEAEELPQAVLLGSAAQEARWIGHAILERHLLQGVALLMCLPCGGLVPLFVLGRPVPRGVLVAVDGQWFEPEDDGGAASATARQEHFAEAYDKAAVDHLDFARAGVERICTVWEEAGFVDVEVRRLLLDSLSVDAASIARALRPGSRPRGVLGARPVLAGAVASLPL